MASKERNWSAGESTFLMQLVEENKEITLGKFNQFVTAGKKRETWKDIASKLNANFFSKTGGREWQNVKKKYCNIKQSAKKKNSLSKHPPTGNVPHFVIFTEEEETYLKNNDGTPSIDGIDGGIETISVNLEEPVIDDIDLSLTQAGKEESTVPPPPRRENVRQKSKRKSDLGVEILSLDKECQELTIQKLKLEIEILNLKKQKLLNNQ